MKTHHQHDIIEPLFSDDLFLFFSQFLHNAFRCFANCSYGNNNIEKKNYARIYLKCRKKRNVLIVINGLDYGNG